MPRAAARADGLVDVEPAFRGALPAEVRATDAVVELPAEMACAVAELLSGAAIAGRVLGVSTRSVMVELGARVLVLGSNRAHRSPVTVRSTHWPDRMPVGLLAGAAVTAGACRLRTAGLHLRVVRSWDSRVMRIRPDARAVAQLGSAVRSAVRGIPDEPVTGLALALDAGAPRCVVPFADGDPLPRAVRRLIGLGAGSTPAGDDVVAGVLVGLLATGRIRTAAALRRAVGDPVDRTTALSRELLLLAGQGQASGEVLAVLRQLDARNGTPSRLANAIDRLLAVGHTSGADLAAGLLIGLGCGRPIHGVGRG